MTIRILTVVLASVGLITLMASADDGDPKEKVFKAKAAYTAEVAKLRAEMIAIFDKREEKARNDGNKKLLDEIKFYRKLFDDEEEWPADMPDDLHVRLKKAKTQADATIVTAIKECIKAKKDDDAAALEKDLAEFRKELHWSMLDLAKADVKDGYFRIPPSTTITTNKIYKGGVDVTLVARTDAENIRIHAHRSSVVIFNWEINPTELRITRPDEQGSLLAPKITPLKPKVYYTLRWRLTQGGMTVSVNGQIVFSEKRDYNLDVDTKISVESVKSAIDVKEFSVSRIYSLN